MGALSRTREASRGSVGPGGSRRNRGKACWAGAGLQPMGVRGEQPGPAGNREARPLRSQESGLPWGSPSSPASVPGSPTRLPEHRWHSAAPAGRSPRAALGLPRSWGTRCKPGWSGVSMALVPSPPPLPPGPNQATRPSRVSHFEVMGFRALWQAEGADLAGREGAGRAGCPSWLPGSSSPAQRRRPEPEGQGPGLGVREAQFKCHFLPVWAWASHLTSLSLSCFFLQTRGILAALSKEKIYVK